MLRISKEEFLSLKVELFQVLENSVQWNEKIKSCENELQLINEKSIIEILLNRDCEHRLKKREIFIDKKLKI